MPRAAIYTRISLDRDGRSESPERQEADCRALAAERGWDIVDVFEERDVSGYKEGVDRPAFDGLVAALRAGRVDVVLVWKLDRLSRQGITFVGRFLDELRQADAILASATEPFLDPSTPMGEAFLGLIASTAKQESENISVRVRSAQRTEAKRGTWPRGGSRMFGYTRDGEIIDHEAAIIREMAQRVRDGDSFRQIAYDLNERRVRTSQGNEWLSNTVSQVLRSPRIAAFRKYNDDLFEGNWDPILDADDWTSLQAVMKQPKSARRSVASHLLTGLVFCDLCGGRLKTMGFRQKNGKRFERYQCVRQPGFVNCGKIAITKNGLDRYVSGRALDFLAAHELRPLDGDDSEDDLRHSFDEDSVALSELTRQRFVDRTIRQDDYELARQELEAKLQRTEAALAALERRRAERSLDFVLGDRERLQEWWDAASHTERRELLERSFMRVVVRSAKRRGGNQFDSDRVAILWRHSLFLPIVDRWSEESSSE